MPESVIEHITHMIARQCSPVEILAVLCTRMGQEQRERQVAFFLLDGESWSLAATGDLTEQSKAALASIDPEALSNALFVDDGEAGRLECPFDLGWARHLYSGNGELMGLVIGLLESVPEGERAKRTQTICGLALLALEQHNLLGELRFKAEHDSVTGLYNRDYHERMMTVLLRESEQGRASISLLYIGLDRFRLVNDIMGLSVGNQLLRQAGRRFQSCLKGGEVLARVGGDEFAVLSSALRTAAETTSLAESLLRALQTPFEIDGHELVVAASIGISRSRAGSTPKSLEREAYLALHYAKRFSEAKAAHFEPFMDATPPERLEMEKLLHVALAKQEMVLFYQPQVDLRTGLVKGAEALLRWRSSGLGLVAPAAFVPILEETGLIIEFGRWVLNQACRQGRQWIEAFQQPIQIGVNVSAAQLISADFVRDVRLALERSKFPPELLELELTESLFVGNFDMALAIFRELRKSGVKIALDDFGTGQSSLSYLHDTPFHRLKLDQTFVRGSARSSSCSPLMQEIVRMARSLGMETIAEGIETVQDLNTVRSTGCEQAQGFLFGRPLPAQEFTAYCLEHLGAKSSELSYAS